MNAIHKSNETTKQRLERVTESGAPFRAELRGPRHLMVAGLLILMLILVAVGIIGGTLGYDVVYDYARQIAAWATAAGR